MQAGNLRYKMKRLFYVCYNVATILLLPGLFLFLAFRLLRRPEYRVGLSERFGFYPNLPTPTGGRRFWIHAVSVGEAISAGVFIQQLRAKYPDATIIVSTGTPTGRAAAQQRLVGVDRIVYLPFDFFWMVRRAIRRLAPTCFILLETELWPNVLCILGKMGTPVLLMNGRISGRSLARYRCVRRFLPHLFGTFRAMLMQTSEDVARIAALGAPREKLFCTGNMKYDQAAAKPQKTAATLRADLGFGGRLLMIAASLHPGEDEPTLSAYQTLRKILASVPPPALLMAPRHLTRLDEMEARVARCGLTCIRKTAVTSRHNCDVMLLDTLGELDVFYAVGDLIFVGGSLVPVGGHNVLEAAAYGKPVFFGPHMENFQDVAAQLKQSGGGIQISDANEMAEAMARLLRHPEEMRKRGEAAFTVVMTNRGAVARNLEHLTAWID